MKRLLTILTTLLPFMAAAQGVWVNGVYYNVLPEQQEAYVWPRDDGEKYTGSVTIQGSIEYEGTTYPVTQIYSQAFDKCTDLTSVTIKYGGLKRISQYAFRGCTSLKTFEFEYLPSFTEIGAGAFQDCSSLEKITIPYRVEGVGHQAFAGCTSLKKVIFASSAESVRKLKTIGYSAFEGCTSLESISIPKSVEKIESRAFYGCTALQYVAIDNLTDWCNIDMEGNPLSQAHVLKVNGHVVKDLVIPAVTNLKDYTFDGGDFNSVVVSEGTQTIGQGTFRKCTSPVFVLPSTLQSIDKAAFTLCKDMTDMYCMAETPPTVESTTFTASSRSTATLHVLEGSTGAYGDDAQWGQFAGVEVSLPLKVYQFDKLKYRILYTQDAEVIGNSLTSNDTELEVPSSINIEGKTIPVTSIGDNAFYHCYVQKFTLPDCLKKIGFRAFEDSYRLSSLTLPDAVTTIGDRAFANSVLHTITLGNQLETIGNAAFYSCNFLHSLVIPDNVKEIGEEAFSCCYGIETLTLGNQLETIGNAAFMYCKLQSLLIPDNVKEIGEEAFKSNRNLTEITIGDGVTTLDNCFSNCDVVTLRLGANLTYLNDFQNNINLKKVYCKALTPPTYNSSFSGVDVSKAKLLVPSASIAAYKESAGWKDFGKIGDIDQEYPTAITTHPSPTTQHPYYDLSGRRVSNPNNGLYIYNGKKVVIK